MSLGVPGLEANKKENDFHFEKKNEEMVVTPLICWRFRSFWFSFAFQ
jgi:hypothetical protein